MPRELVPTVDLVADPPGELVRALVERSCVFLTSHGVPDDVRADLVATSRAFFDLAREEKARVRWPGDGLWRGWQPMAAGAVDTSAAAQPDVLERFEVQLARDAERGEESVDARAERFALWPERPDGFRRAWTRAYSALGALSDRVVTAIADTLDLPSQDRPAWQERHFANLVVNNYLDLGAATPPGLRQRPHTDIGGLTLLWADDAPGGLEVRMPGVAGWTPVRFPPEVYLVQAGDLLARWTNQKIQANVHQVTNPPPRDGSPSRRVSVVYFHYPELDTVVNPAPSCISEQRPARPSMDAGAHLLSAVARPTARYRDLEAELAEEEAEPDRSTAVR